MLAKNADDRPASAIEVLEAWRELGPATEEAATVASGPVSAQPLAAGPRRPASESPAATQTGLTTGTMTRLGQKPTKLGAALGVGAVVATGAALALMVGARSPSPAPGPPAEGPVSAVIQAVTEPTPGTPAASPPPATMDTAFAPTVAIPSAVRTAVTDAGIAPPPSKSVRRWTGTKRLGSGEPHITDKPRY